MKNAIFDLEAEVRKDLGKGASRRLRRENKIPAILYGSDEAPTPIQVFANKINKALENDAFYSHILTLDIQGQKQQAVLKDLHRHHYKKSIFHLDFQRVKANDVINMKVPIHFLNEEICQGVKSGGIINHQLIDIEIRCQAKDLPEAIEVDMSEVALDEIQGIDEIMDDLLEAHLNAIFIDQGLELVKEQIAKIQQISDQSSFNVKILEKLNERKQYLALSQNTRQQSSVVRPQQARRESEIVHFHSLSTSSVVSPREKNGTIKEQPKKVSPKSPRSLRKVK